MKQIPLCVDLDGTLIQSDLLIETLLVFVKLHPAQIFFLPFWLIKGRAYLKRRIAEQADFDASALIYSQEVLEFLREQVQIGVPVILATGSDQLAAKRVYQHLNFFSGMFASDGNTNLTSGQKANRLVSEFGENGFDYLGNSHQDLAVWKKARKCLIYSKNSRLIAQIKAPLVITPSVRKRGTLYSALLSLRPHQWTKNLLIFIPAFASHRIFDFDTSISSFLAFCAFSAVASSSYLINDLLDLESDRKHKQKRFRPLAHGDLSPLAGILLCVGMLMLGIAFTLFLPLNFVWVLTIYYLTSLFYSMKLKQMVLIDVLTLAALYTIRIIAGHEAATIRYSHWLLTFALFFFLSLALVKRYSELISLSEDSEKDEKIHGRSYRVSDRLQVAILGISSGQISVLISMLYLNSQEISVLYNSPKFMWAICPLLLYWINRVWFLAGRGQMHHDPIVFALKDKTSYLTGALIGIAAALATLA